MQPEHALIERWYNPSPEQLGHSVFEFIERLQRPTLIEIDGRDNSRTRIISTLLHGNEPSGLHAVYAFLSQQLQPAVRVVFFIGAVQAAKQPPVFSYRQLPGEKDLNRCFKPPFDSYQGKVARALLSTIHDIQPECLVDIHNTSGSGPSFAVSIRNDLPHQTLVSHFTERLIVTDLRLGALMELAEREVPTITVECGGAQDKTSHLMAIEAVERFLTQRDVFAEPETDWGLEILHNPIRVELKPDATLAYEVVPVKTVDVTLPPDIERLNFGFMHADTQLGWLGDRGLDCFNVVTHAGDDVTHEILTTSDGKLYPAQTLKAFMITTNPGIAKSDCLFYAVTAR